MSYTPTEPDLPRVRKRKRLTGVGGTAALALCILTISAGTYVAVRYLPELAGRETVTGTAPRSPQIAGADVAAPGKQLPEERLMPFLSPPLSPVMQSLSPDPGGSPP